MSRQQRKSGTVKKHRPRRSGGNRRSDDESYTSDGAMNAMVSGFRRAIGSGSSRRKAKAIPWVSAVLLIIAAAILAWRFL